MIIWKILKFFFKLSLVIALIFTITALLLLRRCTSDSEGAFRLPDKDTYENLSYVDKYGPEPPEEDIDKSIAWRYGLNDITEEGVVIQCPICGKYLQKDGSNFCSYECECKYWSWKENNESIKEARNQENNR